MSNVTFELSPQRFDTNAASQDIIGYLEGRVVLSKSAVRVGHISLGGALEESIPYGRQAFLSAVLLDRDYGRSDEEGNAPGHADDPTEHDYTPSIRAQITDRRGVESAAFAKQASEESVDTLAAAMNAFANAVQADRRLNDLGPGADKVHEPIPGINVTAILSPYENPFDILGVTVPHVDASGKFVGYNASFGMPSDTFVNTAHTRTHPLGKIGVPVPEDAIASMNPTTSPQGTVERHLHFRDAYFAPQGKGLRLELLSLVHL